VSAADEPLTAEPELVNVGAPGEEDLTDSRAATRFDTFLFAAAATVLITRAILKATGYPQLGGHSQLHVAHVLWGGLLLGLAMTIMMVSLGSAAKFWASLIGGIGFGLFIDEIGKFLTKDVNYFFRPAIAIIYGTLITAYVLGREALRRLRITGPRARAIAAIAIADNELGELSQARRTTVEKLLSTHSGAEADVALRALLGSARVGRRLSSEDWVAAVNDWTHDLFAKAAGLRWVRLLMVAALIAEVVNSLTDPAFVIIAQWLTTLDPTPLSASDLANFASDTLQSTLIGCGLFLLARHDWVNGLRAIRMGLFFALMFTTVMEFADQQLHALADFAFAAILFAIVGAAEQAARRGEIAPRVRHRNSMVAATGHG
jgi:hypothetical protein